MVPLALQDIDTHPVYVLQVIKCTVWTKVKFAHAALPALPGSNEVQLHVVS
jgi:hypothetical protein